MDNLEIVVVGLLKEVEELKRRLKEAEDDIADFESMFYGTAPDATAEQQSALLRARQQEAHAAEVLQAIRAMEKTERLKQEQAIKDDWDNAKILKRRIGW